ncbi:MAG: methylmalonyl-CoA mutase [Candidatus Schekmanbacteria bacterium GWA2_38_11]|uniref:Methylmalonyl-CoA mutase n=1 Tax=Candidatus Schekmanbacteria bacterium GWA2_38_11 TaxID=1817876 RepID=A0A1F7RHT4_9BACT|nr:MAG: methylmalonyl-CoA mutase [Candidatus Schekmanbacteria bacterium GWA2_38_11]
MTKKLEENLNQWENSLKGEKNIDLSNSVETSSHIPVQLLYTPLDLDGFEYERDLGYPGQYPFTRGVQPTMYRGRLWTMRQYAGFGTAEESNTRYRYLLDHGQTGLSIAFDLPTQMGYDSDNPMAMGEVGKVGVAIDSLEDMEILFDKIPLDKVSTSMTINSTAIILLTMYMAVAEKQGVEIKKISGTIQNDILKEYFARGTYIFPPKPSMRIITDIFAFCKDNLPKFNTISVSGYHVREAGSSAVQEIAFTLADGIAYVEAALAAGLKVDDFAKRISFFFNVHNNFLEEISKFRAARRLWAKIMRERFKAQDPSSSMLRFHTQTAGCSLTAQQPDTNIIRVTLQALAAVLGGTQSLHTCSRDEALALPSEESVRIALRTQQILAYESGIPNTVDPLGGSYAIEKLTLEIEKRAQEYIERIDQMGGVLKAIEAGFIQREIQESSYAYQKKIEAKEQIIVGVNQFQVKENPPENLLKVNPELEKKQRGKIEKLKKERDSISVKSKLQQIENCAKGNQNLVPVIFEAVKSYATLGEISDTLRSVFGEYRENVVF